MNETRVWLITGTSSGFGRALAEAALDRGDRVVATARDPGQLSDLAAVDGVHATGLDVTDPRSASVLWIKRSIGSVGSMSL